MNSEQLLAEWYRTKDPSVLRDYYYTNQWENYVDGYNSCGQNALPPVSLKPDENVRNCAPMAIEPDDDWPAWTK